MDNVGKYTHKDTENTGYPIMLIIQVEYCCTVEAKHTQINDKITKHRSNHTNSQIYVVKSFKRKTFMGNDNRYSYCSIENYTQ